MANQKEVASAWRKLSNDALSVAIALENNEPMAIAMSLIEYRFSELTAARMMKNLAQQKIEEGE
jgi:hypothetical protein